MGHNTTFRVSLLLALGTGLMPSPSCWAVAGTEGASFLNIPVGAGPAAVGGGYSALATDAYATVYNPAGLGFLPSSQVAAQHVAYLGTEHYEYLSGVHSFRGNSAWGASMQYLGSGDIAQTDAAGNQIGDFTASFASYNLSYGQRLTEQVSAGATMKWIHGKLSDVTANSVAGDFGVLYKPLPGWTVASTLMNAGRDLKFLTVGDPLPLGWHIGTAYR